MWEDQFECDIKKGKELADRAREIYGRISAQEGKTDSLHRTAEVARFAVKIAEAARCYEDAFTIGRKLVALGSWEAGRLEQLLSEYEALGKLRDEAYLKIYGEEIGSYEKEIESIESKELESLPQPKKEAEEKKISFKELEGRILEAIQKYKTEPINERKYVLVFNGIVEGEVEFGFKQAYNLNIRAEGHPGHPFVVDIDETVRGPRCLVEYITEYAGNPKEDGVIKIAWDNKQSYPPHKRVYFPVNRVEVRSADERSLELRTFELGVGEKQIITILRITSD